MNTDIDNYINALPEERRGTIKFLRELVTKNLPKGYEEVFAWSMLTYQVPLTMYPETYNKKPLMYVGIANQKNYMSLYLIGIYGKGELKQEFERRFKQAGKRLDMGKSCVRFRKLDDLDLDAVAWAISALPMEEFIAFAKQVQGSR